MSSDWHQKYDNPYWKYAPPGTKPPKLWNPDKHGVRRPPFFCPQYLADRRALDRLSEIVPQASSSVSSTSTGMYKNPKKRRVETPAMIATDAAVAARSAAVASAAARAVNKAIEKKWIDVPIPGTAIPVASPFNTNAGIHLLNVIQQGTGFYQRNGRKVKLASLRMRITISSAFAVDVSGNAVSDLLRVALIWDRSPNSPGTLPTFDDIFKGTDATGASDDSLVAERRAVNMDRFTVLRDKVLEINPDLAVANPATYTKTTHIDDYLKIGRETVFSGTANPITVANISTGALYLLFRSCVSAGVTHIVQTDCTNIRLRYLDG